MHKVRITEIIETSWDRFRDTIYGSSREFLSAVGNRFTNRNDALKLWAERFKDIFTRDTNVEMNSIITPRSMIRWTESGYKTTDSEESSKRKYSLKKN